MAETNWVDKHLNEVILYQKKLEGIPIENKVKRIEILSKQLVFIGRLAAGFSEEYKRLYATRKRTYAESFLAATKHRTAVAELAVADLREEEAKAYGNMKRWSNAFESTKEEINALKYKVKIDLEDGSSRNRF